MRCQKTNVKYLMLSIVRRTLSMTSESGDEREGRLLSGVSDGVTVNKARKSLFRKRVKKVD